MASPIHGRNGRVYLGIASSTAAAEPLPNTFSFEINQTVDQVETTVFGDTNKTYVGGLPDFSGSFEAFFDTASAQTYTAAADGQARRFYLYPTTPSTAGPYWFGTTIADFSLSTSVSDAVRVSGNFKGASAVAKVG